MPGFGEALAIQAGSEIAGGLSEQLSYGIGEITGYNDALRKDSLKQYTDMSNIQAEIQKKQYDYQLQQTSPSANMKRLKEAGLNPALMYGMSGAGGSTGTMGSVAGGNTPSSAQIKANNMASQGYAMQLAKLQSEIDVNKSVAKVNEANAEKAGADTHTTEAMRETLIENMKQSGIDQWLKNQLTGWMMRSKDDKNTDWQMSNDVYEIIGFTFAHDSKQAALLTNSVLKSYNDAVASGQLGEAATKNAETNRLSLELQKQMTDYQTGKDIDWKNVGELLVRFVPLILGKGGGGGITINNK